MKGRLSGRPVLTRCPSPRVGPVLDLRRGVNAESVMLDAYIIERIRRQREERREGDFVPLRIEVPQPPTPEPARDEDEDEKPDRGSIIIDFMV